jgi:hypothetical protein
MKYQIEKPLPVEVIEVPGTPFDTVRLLQALLDKTPRRFLGHVTQTIFY